MLFSFFFLMEGLSLLISSPAGCQLSFSFIWKINGGTEGDNNKKQGAVTSYSTFLCFVFLLLGRIARNWIFFLFL